MDKTSSFVDARPPGQLGPLERQVMDGVWGRGSATVRELLEGGGIWQTYQTIMTTMNRLFNKGILSRQTEGRAFRYAPRFSREEFERVSAMTGVRQLLASEYASLHLSYLVEAVGAQDGRLLDELQALVERQRAELKKGDPA